MARIFGIDLDDTKKIQTALTELYGIGRKNVLEVLRQAEIAPEKKAKELTEQEILKIQKVIENKFTVEGDLRRQIQDNIGRLKAIGSYRGLRHSRGLPARGQRTRSNARTKRGKRKTVGAMKKDLRAKVEQTDKAPEK